VACFLPSDTVGIQKTKARSKYQPKLNTVITSVLRPAKEPTQAEIEAQAAFDSEFAKDE